MADVFDKAKRSAVMSAIRSRGNKDTEERLVSIFRAAKLRGWRRNSKLMGKPDFVFREVRVALFVDGCFWHGCPIHGRNPSSNVEYWTAKLKRNEERDRRVSRFLRRAGWSVVRVWEHELLEPRVITRKIRRAIS